MLRLRGKGFSLVEIIIVVAIIAILVALSIPNLLRERINGNQAAAIATVRTVISAAGSYYGMNPGLGYPASLQVLATATPPYIDANLSAGVGATVDKQGYRFKYEIDAAGPPATRCHVFADPVTDNVSGINVYFSDESGVVYTNDDPTAVDPDMQIAGSGTDPGVDWDPVD